MILESPLVACLLALASVAADGEKTFTIRVANESKPMQFGGAELHAALKGAGYEAASGAPGVEFVIAADRAAAGGGGDLPDSLPPEGFAVRGQSGPSGKRVVILGGDARGALYGALDVAERIALGTPPADIESSDGKPAHRIRAWRVNLALGGPEPAPEWTHDVALWESLCDALARDRFDTLMIFAPDPFGPIAAGGAEAAFFERVFSFARGRGLDPVLVATRLGSATRESVARTIAAEPDLRGVGVATDDAIPPGGEDALRDGLLRAIAASGRTDVAAVIGDRGFDPAKVDAALAAAAPPAGAFVLVHYNGDHALSLPRPHFFDPGWFGRSPRRFEPLWNLRSDDAVILPVGDPGFVRETLSAALAEGPASGVLMGSSLDDPGPDSGYVEAERKNVPWKYKFEKVWFPRALWGRLAFDPATPDALFEKRFSKRYGEKAGPRFFKAFVEGSKAIPLVNAFHFSLLSTDFYTEGNLGLTNSGLGRGFNYRDSAPWHDAFEYLFNHTMEDAQIGLLEQTLEKVPGVAKSDVAGRVTVSELADRIGSGAGHCHNTAYELIEEFGEGGGELRVALLDMKALAHYGVSQAQRIRGTLEQALFLSSGEKNVQRRARSFTHNAWGQWKYLWFNTADRYLEIPLGPFGPYLPGKNLDAADKEIDRVQKMKGDRQGFLFLAAKLGGSRPPAGFDFRSVPGYFDFGVPGFDYTPVPLKEGETLVEAEDLGGAWTLVPGNAANGRGARSSGAAGTPAPSGIVRRVKVAAPGTYSVFVRAARGGEDRSVRVALAGTELAVTHGGADGDGGFVWQKAGTVTLSPGEAVLEVRDAGPGAEAVDVIAISNTPGYEPR